MKASETPFADFHEKDWGHQWFKFQWRQELHDRLFHADIYNLTKPHRLTHLVLHHGKYISRIHVVAREYTEMFATGMDKGPNRGHVMRQCIDGIIVCMSMFNVANRLYADSTRLISKHTPEQAVNLLIRHMGLLAKTVEDIDHMAQTKPLEDIVESLVVMMSCYLSLYGGLVDQSLDTAGNGAMRRLFQDLMARLEEIEKKNMFYDRLKEQIDDLMKEPWM